MGAPTQEQLATAMGHSTTTARMHYDRCKPQRDAQRAIDGMQALRHNIMANHGEEVARVVQGVHVADQQQDVVKGEAPAEAPVGAVHSDNEWDIEIDLDS